MLFSTFKKGFSISPFNLTPFGWGYKGFQIGNWVSGVRLRKVNTQFSAANNRFLIDNSQFSATNILFLNLNYQFLILDSQYLILGN